MPKVKKDIAIPLRIREDSVSILRVQETEDGQKKVGLGTVSPLGANQPVQELVRMRPRKEGCPIADIETVGPTPFGIGSGPPQVATKDYRDGWDRIFGETVH